MSKRGILFFILLSFVMSCQNNADSVLLENGDQYQINGRGTDASIALLKPDCNCKDSQANCEADCLFSSCCICFDPTTHEGGCACYLGFSSCKTEPISSTPSSFSIQNTELEELEVTLFPIRIDKYFNYLKQKKYNITVLKDVYSNLLLKSETKHLGNKQNELRVKYSDYRIFYNEYLKFIDSLEEQDKTDIEIYLSELKRNI